MKMPYSLCNKRNNLGDRIRCPSEKNWTTSRTNHSLDLCLLSRRPSRTGLYSAPASSIPYCPCSAVPSGNFAGGPSSHLLSPPRLPSKPRPLDPARTKDGKNETNSYDSIIEQFTGGTGYPATAPVVLWGFRVPPRDGVSDSLSPSGRW